MSTADYPSNEIGDLPGIHASGHTFSYAVWTPGTEITMCNVPWNNDYRDIVKFADKTALHTYLKNSARVGPTVNMDRLTYARPGEPIRINIPFNEVYKYNYIRVRNSPQPVKGVTHRPDGAFPTFEETSSQVLYYFITDVRHIAPNTTEIIVQLDVWQSFSDSITFGNCYIERGHIGIANENNFADNGRKFLTIPEGLDVGGEYVINGVYEHRIADVGGNNVAKPSVLVVSTTSLMADPGDVDNPKLTTASGSLYGGLPNGCDLYLFVSIDSWKGYLASVADKPWVSQGIISVTTVPASFADNLDLVDPNVAEIFLAGGEANPAFRLVGGDAGGAGLRGGTTDVVTMRANWRNDIDLGRYSLLKKFLTYPYTIVELTTYSGTPLILKPESMQSPDLKVIEKMYVAPPSPRVAYMPYRYNTKYGHIDETGGDGALHNDGGEMFDMMTGIFNMPTFSVVNNGYMSYMAANAHGIAYQHSSADWSQARATQGADVANANAFRSAGATYQSGKRAMQAMGQTANLASETAMYRGMQQLGNHTADGLQSVMSGNPNGGINAMQGQVNSGIDYAITANQISKQFGIDYSVAAGNNATAFKTANQNNDSNLEYANFAAKGDYENAIAGINAKVQDARMTQPTTSGQIGGDAFILAVHRWALWAKVKVVQPAVMAAVGEYWLRYGYAVNRFSTIPNDFQVMSKFTYWKLRETYIQSSQCPETFRQTIRGIFEKGVTVWSNADDIGMIDIADNVPKAGVTL